ncbi:MAG: class II glutamine amidotransferase [Acidimicrobiia bacterium]|nr:MAG: class II glutamine amidotransferase [Acidimicrobiia bacterium]
MCRLYGFLATEPTRLECSLVAAQNALQVQSDRDSRGVRNADGWGIAHREGDRPAVIKSTDPAFADHRFAEAATSVSSDSVIAHIRAATVGGVAERNTHPFTHGPWSFAHNGTIPGIEHVATHLDLGRFGPPEGETDSELAFLWILNRMADYGLDPEAPAENLDSLVDLVADAVLELVRITIQTGATEPPKLNFLLSDGRHMVASRWGHTLYWTFRRGIRDCTVCGTSHCPAADETYRSVVIASEPITGDEDWTELPEGSVLGVAPNAHTMKRDLLEAAHR